MEERMKSRQPDSAGESGENRRSENSRSENNLSGLAL